MIEITETLYEEIIEKLEYIVSLKDTINNLTVKLEKIDFDELFKDDLAPSLVDQYKDGVDELIEAIWHVYGDYDDANVYLIKEKLEWSKLQVHKS